MPFAPIPNKRRYLLVSFSSHCDERFLKEFDPESLGIPGRIREQWYVSNLKVIDNPTAYADRGKGYALVRTGWDNVAAAGVHMESAPRYGIHFLDLPRPEQQGIVSYYSTTGGNVNELFLHKLLPDSMQVNELPA